MGEITGPIDMMKQTFFATQKPALNLTQLGKLAIFLGSNFVLKRAEVYDRVAVQVLPALLVHPVKDPRRRVIIQ